MKPFGTPLTIEQAARAANRGISTIYRWVQRELVRTDHRWDHDLGYSVMYLSGTDVLELRDKKWPRRKRSKLSM